MARSLGLAIAVLALTGVPSAAAADLPIRLVVRPTDSTDGWLTVRVRPGESQVVSLDLVNTGVAPVRARTYAADAYTLINGGFGARGPIDKPTGPTLWLSYESASLDLDPGQPVSRDMVVTVPTGTPSGEYAAAVVLQNEEAVPVEGQQGLVQTVRAAMAVIVDVPGQRQPGMSIHGVDHAFSAGTSVVGFGLSNDGRVRLKPTASFELQRADGSRVTTLEAPLDSIYAATATRVELPLASPLSPGRYRARLQLSDREAPASADSGWLEFMVEGDAPGVASSPAVPLPALAILAIAATILGVGVVRVRQNRKKDSRSGAVRL